MKKIVIVPYSSKLKSGKENPKNYPHFEQVVKLLKEKNYYIIQVSLEGETQIPNCDEYKTNLPFKEISNLIKECHTWISVDSFLPHLVNCEKLDKQGIVIFSQSDPKIFGYPENINLLKDKKFLRKEQFHIWEQCTYNSNAYVSPAIIIQNIEKIK